MSRNAPPGDRRYDLHDSARAVAASGKAPAFVPIDGADPLEYDEVAREIARLGAELRARNAQ